MPLVPWTEAAACTSATLGAATTAYAAYPFPNQVGMMTAVICNQFGVITAVICNQFGVMTAVICGYTDSASSGRPVPRGRGAAAGPGLTPRRPQPGFRHTEMCFGESWVNGAPSQSATRRSSRSPAIRAMRSSSAGQA